MISLISALIFSNVNLLFLSASSTPAPRLLFVATKIFIADKMKCCVKMKLLFYSKSPNIKSTFINFFTVMLCLLKTKKKKKETSLFSLSRHCGKAEFQVGEPLSAPAPNDCNYHHHHDDCWTLDDQLSRLTHTKSLSRTWDEDGQQLLDGVHGVDEHLPVLLVRQLLLPLLNQLRHFGHPWRKCGWGKRF